MAHPTSSRSALPDNPHPARRGGPSALLAATAALLLVPLPAVASNSGANTLAVHLEVVPGARGIEPELLLRYDSRGALGPVGFGWTLEESSVVLDRRSDSDPLGNPARGPGGPSYRLDGLPLVFSGATDGATWWDWWPEPDDGSVLREQLVPSGATAFVLHRPDGSRWEYGTTQDSRSERCAAGTCVTTRARLARMEDRHGLAVVYEYVDLGDEQRYLAGILYTLDDGAPAQPEPDQVVGPLRSAQLHYAPVPTPWVRWELGERVQLGHRLSAIEQRVATAADPVRTYEFFYEETLDGGWVLTDVEEEGALPYGSLDNRRPLLTGLTYTPDGPAWDGIDPGRLPGSSWTGCLQAASFLHDGDRDGVSTDWFDLTGDGAPDCVTTYLGGSPWGPRMEVWASDTAGVQVPAHNGTRTDASLAEFGLVEPGGDPFRIRTTDGNDSVLGEFLDFDGDGSLDRVFAGRWGGVDGLWWQRRDGHLHWAPPLRIDPAGALLPLAVAGEDPASDVGQVSGLVDVTGDARPDYVEVFSQGLVVWRNDGAGFLPPEIWGWNGTPWVDLSFGDAFVLQGYDLLEQLRGLVDLNGDGLLDRVEAEQGVACGSGACRWIVQMGTGEGFEAARSVSTGFPGSTGDYVPLTRIVKPACAISPWMGPPCSPPPTTLPEAAGVHLADLDGDGLPDLVRDDEVAFNLAGAEFDVPQPMPMPWGRPTLQGAGPLRLRQVGEFLGRYQDFDGDGLVDWVSDTGFDRLTRGGERLLPPHLLTSITRPTGGITSFAYEPAAGTVLGSTRDLAPGSGGALPRLWNLASVTHSQPDVGDLSFSYEEPDGLEGSFHGYGVVEVLRADGSRTRSEFHVGGDPAEAVLAGRPRALAEYAPDGSLLSIAETVWAVQPGRTAPGGATVYRAVPQEWTETAVGRAGAEVTARTGVTLDPTTGRPETVTRFGAGLGGADQGWLLSWSAVAHPRGNHGSLHVLDRVERLDEQGSPYSFVAFARDTLGRVRAETSGPPAGPTWAMRAWDYDARGFLTGHDPDAWDPAPPNPTNWSPDYLTHTTRVRTTTPLPPVLPAGHPTPGPVDHVELQTRDARFGRIVHTELGEAGAPPFETDVELDAFGRPLRTHRRAPGGPALLVHKSRYHLRAPTPWIEREGFDYDPSGVQTARSWRRAYLDEFGREVQSRTLFEDNGAPPSHHVTWTERDGLGRTVRASEPVLQPGIAASPAPWSSLVYSERSFAPDGRRVTAYTWSPDPADAVPGAPMSWEESDWDVPTDGKLLRTSSRPGSAGPRVESETLDSWGRLRRQIDAIGGTTLFDYDHHGRMATVEDALGHVTSISWDAFDRRETLHDPSTGLQTFEYDNRGRPTSRTDAEGRTVAMEYDELGRPVWRTGGCEPSGLPGASCADPGEGTSFFFYDGVGALPIHGPADHGALTLVLDPSGWTERGHGPYGGVAVEHREVDGTPFEVQVTRDSGGRLLEVEVTAGGMAFAPVRYAYDAAGLLTRVAEPAGPGPDLAWVDRVGRHPTTGRVERLLSMPDATATPLVDIQVDASRAGRLLGIYSTTAATGLPPGWNGELQDIELGWDSLGRTGSRIDRLWTVAGLPSEELYGYDELDRLETVGGPAAGYQRAFQYDAIGRILHSSFQEDTAGQGLTGEGAYTYDPAQPHAVVSVGSHTTLGYDATGALLARTRSGPSPYDRAYGYSSNGRLRTVRELSADPAVPELLSTHLLDGFGNRVKRAVEAFGSPVIAEEVVTPSPFVEVRGGVPVKKVLVGGRVLGETSAPRIGPTDEVVLHFYDGRAQSTARLVLTDVAGSSTPRPTYVEHEIVRRDPHGNVVAGSQSGMPHGAGGGRQEPLDEVFLGWRLYAPELGRFLQADTLASATVGRGQGLDRFRYAWNAPTLYSDPSGHWEVPISLPLSGLNAGGLPVGDPVRDLQWLRGVGADRAGGALSVGISTESGGPRLPWFVGPVARAEAGVETDPILDAMVEKAREAGYDLDGDGDISSSELQAWLDDMVPTSAGERRRQTRKDSGEGDGPRAAESDAPDINDPDPYDVGEQYQDIIQDPFQEKLLRTVREAEDFGAEVALEVPKKAGELWILGKLSQLGGAVWAGFSRTLQTGGRTVSGRTARALNKLIDRPRESREWGRALERLKKDNLVPSDHHGKILSDGSYTELDGTVIENILDYLD